MTPASDTQTAIIRPYISSDRRDCLSLFDGNVPQFFSAAERADFVLGKMLTTARLRAAQTTPGVVQLRIDTSQHTQAFYRRFGFTVEKIVLDGYGPGLDRWDMLLRF